MSCGVTIIIPSYNKYYELKLLLFSLERQSIPPSEIEVVVVDDGSTDRTPRKLIHYHPPYKFVYLRNEKRKGRAYTRNRGIDAAKGNILIFLDAEMIVETDFVKNHLEHHLTHSNRIVSGGMHLRGTFTVYYPNFSREVHEHLYSLLKQDRQLYKHCKPIIKEASENKKPSPFLTRKNIEEGIHRKLSFPLPYFPEILHKFGPELKDYALPWTSFLTGNVSLQKSMLARAGQFEETFRGWGFEDWELGYRLYRCGAVFLAEPKVGSYHQEHPVSYKQVKQEMYENYYYYQRKHPHFETGLHSAFLLGNINRIQEHSIVSEYRKLVEKYPGKYDHFIDALIHMFRYIADLLKSGCEKDEILERLKREVQVYTIAREERNTFVQSNLFPHLVQLFDQLAGIA